MKNLLLLCSILISVGAISQVTNEDVIKMSKAGLSQDIILGKIATETPDFKTEIDDLIDLKSNNVADTIIKLMVYRQKSYKTAVAKTTGDNGDGSGYIFPSSGIYFAEDDNYTALDPTLVTSSRGKGTFGYKMMAQIEGSEANYDFAPDVEFYFNFDDAEKSLNSANANDDGNNYFTYLASNNAQAISPNEFKLVKLNVKKGMLGIGKTKEQREYVTGKINAMGKTDMSIDSKYIVNFKYKKISDNTYRVYFPSGLEPGQYCFTYAGNNNSNPYFLNQNNIKVYDFGIE